MNLNSNNLLLVFSLLLIAVSCAGNYMLKKHAGKDDTFSRPYSVNILDDHRVQLIHKVDTVILFLENSAAFNDETVVFINKK